MIRYIYIYIHIYECRPLLGTLPLSLTYNIVEYGMVRYSIASIAQLDYSNAYYSILSDDIHLSIVTSID